MSDPVDPTGGWAAATEATANASKEAIKASRELGRFIGGFAHEVVGILEDHLKVVRFERRVRLADRVRNFLIERGMTGPTRKIPLSIAVPLLENATLEEDDDLREIWARLIVNGGDAGSGIELRRAFVSVLAEMTSLDVRNLAQIERAAKLLNAEIGSYGVWTYELPERALPFVDGDPVASEDGPSPEVAISLSNLERLGCIISEKTFNQASVLVVNLTPFGRALIDACTR